jgi:hypothetical protein
LLAIKERKALRGGVKRQSTWKVDEGELETRRQKRVAEKIHQSLFVALENRRLLPIQYVLVYRHTAALFPACSPPLLLVLLLSFACMSVFFFFLLSFVSSVCQDVELSSMHI